MDYTPLQQSANSFFPAGWDPGLKAGVPYNEGRGLTLGVDGGGPRNQQVLLAINVIVELHPGQDLLVYCRDTLFGYNWERIYTLGPTTPVDGPSVNRESMQPFYGINNFCPDCPKCGQVYYYPLLQPFYMRLQGFELNWSIVMPAHMPVFQSINPTIDKNDNRGEGQDDWCSFAVSRPCRAEMVYGMAIAKLIASYHI